ncbi:Murein DD-endopeptidase MepM and murein hydrolase activator NlpD, contain LysM domain [Salinibacillus kushneri]|uniref:Murein DD-endopeptidase MepM and murein hydrolase activator NlpD, contain LysM domain n=1 Tax=Salinibacillus kushneri TaxID=237682 RepID=A0A1I0IAD1_9BACI|nr:M23 family metallopeptidase [Salinibacillus kushneri]SET93584.1 Murein DD-endopeptidase MepM and murein hydrolase activator NlpD, contain LysM domain [Salinibacillus kushneri]
MLDNKYQKASKNKQKALVPKVVLTTCLSIGITLGSGTIHADKKDDDLPRVYHVYMDGEHIGTVGSKEVIESFLNKKVEEEENKREDVELAVSQDISYIPEVTFEPVFNNQRVINQLKNEITYSLAAVKLEVGGELVGYFKDEDSVQKLLSKYMDKYLPKDTVQEYIKDIVDNNKSEETGSDSDEKTHEKTGSDSDKKSNEKSEKDNMKVGDSNILDVSFSEKVSISDEKVDPKEILTIDQGIKLLKRGTLGEKVHKVKSGEALSTIADQYELSVPELLSLNPDLNEDSIIQIGDKVNVTGYEPFLNIETTEEKVVEKEMDYETEHKKTDNLYKGQTKVKQQGQEGSKKIHYRLEKKNGKVVNREVLDSEVMKEPVKKIVLEGTKVIPSRGTGDFKWPAAGGYVSSGMGQRWGSFHKGIDIARPSNRSIYAADNGVVESAGYDSGGYGNRIVINHKNGYKTTYSHLSSIKVNAGQTVKKGQVIGIMGSTGHSTGTHLHFEVYKNGSLQNPSNYF